MKRGRSPALYIGKAERALAGAHLLLEAGDSEGACSRAYYAMFDAGCAALLATDDQSQVVLAKTHSGLLAAIGKYLVVSGKVDPMFGWSINQVQELRLAADYLGDPIAQERATWAVAQAEAFVATMRTVVQRSES